MTKKRRGAGAAPESAMDVDRTAEVLLPEVKAAPLGNPAARTTTLDGHEHPALTLAPRTPVTSLRFFGRAHPALPLPRTRRRFSIGSGACDLVIPRELSTAVSGFHALVERVGPGLLLQDQQSKNGLFHALTAPRDATVRVQAGEPFWLGDVGLLPMDEELELLRPQLARRLGLEQDDAIDRALERIATGRPLALIGPPGLRAIELAEAIHTASAHRNHFFLVVDADPLPSLAHVHGGTVVVVLDPIKRLSAPYAAALFERARGLRPIFVAHSERTLWAHLDHYRTEIAGLALVPLSRRRGDVARLLAMHWIDELRTGRRVEELGRGLDAIAAHAWPRDLDELYEQSPRLLAYLEHGTLRAAAAALGVTHQTLAGHFARIGFRIRGRDGAL